MKRKTGFGLIFLVMSLAMLVGCGNSVEETEPESTLPAVTQLEWETPVIELGDSFTFDAEPETYVQVEDETLYDQLAVDHNVDTATPGEYAITVSGLGQEFDFPVIVEDTTYPEMEVVYDYYTVQPGYEITTDIAIPSYEDNDAECEVGFYGLEKERELEEFSYEESLQPVGDIVQTKLEGNIEIISSLVAPDEEGVYKGYAVVRDRSGNAATCQIYIVVDGTAPEIDIPDSITIALDGDLDFGEEATVTDNVYPADEIVFGVDTEELENIADNWYNGVAGTFPLTYKAADGAGNTSEAILEVTLVAPTPSNPPASSNGENESNTENNSGSENTNDNNAEQPAPEQPQTSQEAYYDDAMAREAFGYINEYRVANGLPELTWNDTLYEGAKTRAKELVTSMSHTRPDGSSCSTILSDLGLSTNVYFGENIAYGYDTRGVADGWYNSEGHRANMLKAEYTNGAIGCYCVAGVYYWVNLFMG